MKKNNKGFTLVELLAVLVILITILMIAIPSISSSVERNKEKMLEKKYDIIEAAAESYVKLHKNNIDYYYFLGGGCGITTDEIIEKGILTYDDLKDGENYIYGAVWYDEYDGYVFERDSDGGYGCEKVQ